MLHYIYAFKYLFKTQLKHRTKYFALTYIDKKTKVTFQVQISINLGHRVTILSPRNTNIFQRPIFTVSLLLIYFCIYKWKQKIWSFLIKSIS